MGKIPRDSEQLTVLHYDGKIAIFPNVQEAGLAFAAALREDMGGYRHVRLTQAQDRLATHLTFVEWFCTQRIV